MALALQDKTNFDKMFISRHLLTNEHFVKIRFVLPS